MRTSRLNCSTVDVLAESTSVDSNSLQVVAAAFVEILDHTGQRVGMTGRDGAVGEGVVHLGQQVTHLAPPCRLLGIPRRPAAATGEQ